MQSINDAATAFLANRRVAVTGVSREPKTHGANTVYKRLRERGYQVFAVNPNADEVEGDPEAAALAYEEVLRALPDAAPVHARLASVHARRGDLPGLRRELAWLEEHAPTEPALPELRQALQAMSPGGAAAP